MNSPVDRLRAASRGLCLRLCLLTASLAPALASAAASPSCFDQHSNQPLIQDRQEITPRAGRASARGDAFWEPDFHICMLRATDHVADGISGFAVNDYSRREPFNADDTRFIVNSGNGNWYLYDADSLKRIALLDGLSGDAEPQWHPTDPNTLYYLPINGGTRLYALDLSTNASRVVADFAGKLPWPNAAHVWTRSEGSPSRDARYWGFQVEDDAFHILGLIVWDLPQNRLVGSKNVSVRPDHVSMSPSGRWIVASGADGVLAYSADFSVTKRLYTKTEHSDIAVGADGHDVFVSIDYDGNDGNVYMVDIDTGVRTDLFPTYLNGAASAMHFSGKAYDRPGWVLISTYADKRARDGRLAWYAGQIFAVQLHAAPKIYRFAFHRARANGYWSEPHAAVDRDFTRVLYSSNWGGGSDADLDVYQLRLPPFAVH